MAIRQTAKRRQEIANLLLANTPISIKELADKYEVSRETIRKDLLHLEQEGLGKKGRGSTFFVTTARERALEIRLAENIEKKAAIANAAAKLIPSGAVIFLDAGSTTLELARLLKETPDLRIITNSATIPSLLADGACAVSCLGGDLRKSSLAFTGSWTLSAIESLHVDIAFLGVDGFDEQGPCTSVYAEAEVKKAMARNAYQTIILCDSTKLDKTSVVSFCQWEEIDMLITDSGICESNTEKMKKRLTLVIAD